jgi:hypothetical protein
MKKRLLYTTLGERATANRGGADEVPTSDVVRQSGEYYDR